MKYQIEVEVSKLEVDERYYSFSYKVSVNGKLKDKGRIEDDYENGDTPEEWRETLEDGYALSQAMVRAF